MAAERGTSDEMEVTRHRAHNQWRRLEADDCDRTYVRTLCASVTINSFPVGGDARAHHAALLTLTPQCSRKINFATYGPFSQRRSHIYVIVIPYLRG